ncbi:ATP phosphoribosyltransferase regulatory subunit [Roseicyclus sp. F158]|uniref:ATP phosphoribosyltransferase regulatory subunit n=1 Tax=Tropicimonas omnivorans TaxID=3075590 RepID=A0ABU3DDU2_9RHOB|nr:ATP phosphoribosyltransferase regulatory subunit [Roseicyclus sp. F158]MDT0681893.1 ATP phosphoribosyltransferase regulatory subunit [Roseicyclus sp. F158]
MPDKAAIRAEAARLLAAFENTGAVPVEAEILQPAGTLLDLYGEDIRARAFTTDDPLQGEMMLRPDFTVPVVEAHMREGAEPARYCYAGEVFRRQEVASAGRAAETMQVGLEFFSRADPAAADAEVFALFSELLAPLGLRAAMGDIGLLTAAVEGLGASPRRRAALMRHLWRPRRFKALLDRYAGRSTVPPARKALLDGLGRKSAEELVAKAGPEIGLRSASEVVARIGALAEDAAEDRLSAAEVEVIDDLLAVRADPENALARLEDIAVDMPAMEPAAARLADRLDALAKRGVDLSAIEFEGSYGRTSMEYYDGFVFGFYAPGRPDLPPVATGGRYDALCSRLGGGRSIEAVGGVIRPGLALALTEGAP